MAQAVEALNNLIREELPTRSKRVAKFTGLIKTLRLHRKTDKKQKDLDEWKVYRKKAGKNAMGLARWLMTGKKKEGKKIAYYGQGRETADAKLRRIKEGK
jgi:hypothetical protein